MNDAANVRVLLVMKQTGNVRVTTRVLAEHGVAALGVSGEKELHEALASDVLPDLALVDVSGFGSSAWRMCATLQGRNLPFIVLFQPSEFSIGSQSLQFGAMSMLEKPVAKSALLQLIHSLVVR